MSFYFRKQRRVEDQHLDDWLMTYADMITLLLCFFAVLLAISQPEKEKFAEAREQMREKFSGTSTFDGDKPTDFLQGKFPLPPAEKTARETSEVLYDALPAIVDRYRKNKDVEVTKGSRITTIEMNAAPFFARGSADLSEEGIKLLADLLTTLQAPDMKDYMVTVEGHTDDIPINTPQFPSNWELSTARAAAVVRYLIAQGIPAQRLRASGYADAFPKVPNAGADGKPIAANQAANRRVVIKLEKIDKSQNGSGKN